MNEESKRGLFTGLQLAFVLVAAVTVYGFVTVAKEAEHRRACIPTCLIRPLADYAGADRKAPEFALKDMKGHEVKLSDYRGKVVILNFWTKTCGPCLKEMPALSELTQILADRSDVVVLAVSTDEGPDDIRDTLKGILRTDPPFNILFDPDGEGVVRPKFGTHLFPETWFIDKRGVVRERFDGGRDWTNPAVVELIDQLRDGTYCPIHIDKKVDREGAEAARFCEPLSGG